MSSRTFRLGDRLVGNGSPVYVIAEAGVNHDGELSRALKLVEAAAAAGADAVKFQTFDPASLVVAGTRPAQYQRDRAGAQDQRAMLEMLALDEASFRRIAAHSAECDVTFLSTPFDGSSVALLKELGVVAYKVGSGDLTNLPFLEELAGFGRPMLLSTGMADLADVDAALVAAHRGGAKDIALLHCVSAYPAPPDQANLRAIDTLSRAYPDVVVGYSDHCLGLDVSLAAVARGAAVLERHLTLDRGAHGPDHALSLEPAEFADLTARVRTVRAALGDGVKMVQPGERDVRTAARRSLVATRGLRSGETLDATALTAKRPAGGIPPGRMRALVGRRLTRDVPADTQLHENHLAPEA